ncbi:MAG: pyrroloquinoline quinone-dependent dehydrogenase [Bryobacteraceae bacterium]|nr:pyrroloquinoline quinone-dependent dehydrogenase [Bryobacteraceae bacterium]
MRVWVAVLATAAACSAAPKRMLWAGSSSVYYHNLPNAVAKALGPDYAAEIAGRSGDSIQVYLKPGSFKPEYGLPDGLTFVEKIKRGKYSHVVLQVVTHFMTGSGGAELDSALDEYCRVIRESGAEPVFFEMGWGRDPINDEGRVRVMAAARRNGVKFYAPVSSAWKRVRAERPEIELHNLPDRVHPGTVGHYLNLAVFVATLGGRVERIPNPYLWWPNLDDAGKAESAKRLAEAKLDAYERALPEFLQKRSVMAKPHTLDAETAAYLRKVAVEETAAAKSRLAEPATAWLHYGADAGGTRYSNLSQIHRGNVNQLKVAWTYNTGDIADGTGNGVKSAFEATPIVVDGAMYLVSALHRLIALDAETGRELWTFDPKLDRVRPQMLYTHRGAAYWTDGRERRLFYGTLDGQLWAIDAKTGRPAAGFGEAGAVDLRRGVTAEGMLDGSRRGYGMTSPPLIFGNLVICGSIVPDADAKSPLGDVRAFDARTGKLVWTFHVIPRDGEFGVETWEERSDGAARLGDSRKGRGAANMWSIASLDEKRGLVFLPLTSPANDRYGGDRPGANLFGDALVALDAATGKRVWHFQTVHHDLWDYDLPAQPVMTRMLKGGKLVDAVAQVTKMGFTFVFDRETGAPLFDVVEKPVPASEVPGERAYPTQPFPVAPPPFARQSFSKEELTDVTPESRAFCETLIEGAALAPMYTPTGLKRTILFPGTNGGANWGGASYDPVTRTLYVNSMDVGQVGAMVKNRPGAELPYRMTGAPTYYSRFWDRNRWPCQKPPWGHLTAIDLDKGEFKWRVTLGVVDALIEKGLPPTGTSNLGGSIVTAGGLLFIGATDDSRFRAFDKYTGKEIWTVKVPASAHATPMTFQGLRTKKQFVVVAAGGGNKYNDQYDGALIAYSLP